MTDPTFLQAAEKFEIQSYKRPRNIKALLKSHVPFTGSPRRHPYDDHKVILVPDPYSSHTHYYEFKTEDITHAEELASLVDANAEAVPMVRLWVKKRSIAVQCSPFVVDEIRSRTVKAG
jgi:hypothetical protein